MKPPGFVLSPVRVKNYVGLKVNVEGTCSRRWRCCALTSSEEESGESGAPRNDPDWMFFDVAKVYVKGGDGGNGCVAFRREKGAPRGGPSGGTGGRGGSVVFVADSGKNTLGKFRGRVHFRADGGKNGINKGKHGESAEDLRVSVPVGTVIRDESTGILIGDLSTTDNNVVVAYGGRGGRGNEAFKTARNVAPRMAEKGELGEERWLKLELKLLADVGLVGVPNAGKSTLLSVVSNAKPKIADYPFTTVVPNLGVVDFDDGTDSLVFADIPGLLEGAHSGVGLGVAFLRHIERCRVVVHVLNGDAIDPVGDYRAINQELELFNPRLLDKPQIVLLNKVDLPHVRDSMADILMKLEATCDHKRILVVSAVSGENIQRFLVKLRRFIASLPEEEPDFGLSVELAEARRETELAERRFEILGEGPGTWRVVGRHIERVAGMTNWDYIEAVDRFQRVLAALGISQALKVAGARDGDLVRISDFEFEFYAEENVYTAMAISDGFTD
mmetsp:Transcript_13301/g.27018  ORF Transcript_13301/g.27018 Transcript_13301/m.27018 type:complete len:501 (-) Transcript_13301:2135-3637(-)|eukprot:CAMPEP_0184682678 /NCGR_PEP_ID=MMETSP0312-20130426/8245_1 /TAXON_ID=31354 /ORGANISM="Compsopogon coeruleus, Strain SAG 36.94" /LENGTH=500 /DNA_ID=CAMNT_0027134497 /DNA_START=25 /DNA_END=1527 /DNA_ORIENTATION=+